MTDLKDVMTGSNSVVLRNIIGPGSLTPSKGVTVHLHDVAKIHVLSLDKDKIDGDQAFILTTGGVEAMSITRRMGSSGVISRRR